MRRSVFISVLTIATMILAVTASHAEVTFKIQKQLNMEETPLDIKVSRSGLWLYILTKEGHLRIYSNRGVFTGKINVGDTFDQIEPGPTDEEIYLKSSSRKSIQVLEIYYSQTINIKGSPFKGREDAPIVIVDFTDFQCPYCAKLVPIFEKLLARYPDQIKIVYKSFPLRSHKFAQKAAAAAIAADQKGKFWEFHDQLFANHDRMSDAVINDIQKALNLDTSAFNTLKNSPQVKRSISQDIAQGKQIGVKSTPSVFVNGKLQTNKSFQGFVDTIEKELKQLKKGAAKN